MLIYSIGVSIDGFVADRGGDFNWTAPTDEVFGAHLAEVSGLGAYVLGRRLYEAMRVWETDPSLRDSELRASFADVWAALPKLVFSRTLEAVEGNARLARRELREEIEDLLAGTRAPVSIGGAELAGQALELGLLDEVRVFRHPVIVGAGKPHLPAVPETLAFELAETRAFDSGVIFERFRR